jgi:two-component system NtrC family sensor kinase
MADLLPVLHQRAIAAGGAASSVLLEFDRRAELLRPTSAFGLEFLAPDPWFQPVDERRIAEEVLAGDKPVLIDHLPRQLPDVADRLGARAAWLVPLMHFNERRGMLILGLGEAPTDDAVEEDLGDAADAFVLALERSRMQQDLELQREVRSLLGVARSVVAPYGLTLEFERFCQEANRLFAADSTTLWAHDRKHHELVLVGSADGRHIAHPARVSTGDAIAPAAVTLRRDRAELGEVPPEDDGASTRVIATVPLKGRRRALGALILEGLRLEPGLEGEALDHLDELGRQLSSALENAQLFDEVLRSRRELEDTFNSMRDLIVVSDGQFRIVRVNEAFATRTGLSRRQLADRPLADFVSADLVAWLTSLDLLSNAEPWKTYATEMEDPTLGGTLSVTVTPLFGPVEEPRGSVLVARDVTQEKRVEIERVAWRDRLAQSETLAALGQLVAGIAHELNNPLQGVLGNLELIRRDAARPQRFRRELQTAYKEADRAAKIVRNLLVFAGSRRLAHRSTSVNAVLTRTLALRGAALRAAKIQVRRSLADELPRVSGDPLLLQQAFLNIIINAEQAVAGREGARLDVRSSYSPTLSIVTVEIGDNGPGIPAPVLPKIFDPFFTTKEVGVGTGLGLAITYRIVEAHGGIILAANAAEGGAVFSVQIPVSGSDTVRQPGS